MGQCHFGARCESKLHDDDYDDPQIDVQGCCGQQHEELLQKSSASRKHLQGVSVTYLSGELIGRMEKLGFNRTSTVREIEPAVIRPFGANIKCPRDGRMGAAYVDCLRNGASGMSRFMLSYTWGYTVEDIVDTLTDFCTQRGLKLESTYIWICCFCINQHRVQEMREQGKYVRFEELDAAFGACVRGTSGVIAMMAPWTQPEYLKRVWCCYEIFRAIDWNTELTIAMPPREAKKFNDAIRNRTAAMQTFDAISRINIEEAESFSALDKQNILKLVQEKKCKWSDQGVNGVIKQYMQRWMVKRMCQVFTDVFEEGNVYLGFQINMDLLPLINQVAHAYRAHDTWRKTMQRSLEYEGRLLSTGFGIVCLFMQVSGELIIADYDAMDRTIALACEARSLCEEKYITLVDATISMQAWIWFFRDSNYMKAKESFRNLSSFLEAIDPLWLNSDNGLNIRRLEGECLHQLGDLVGAMEIFEEVLESRRKYSLDRLPFHALLLRNMGDTVALRGDFLQARQIYEEALSIRNACGTVESWDGAVLLQSMARVLKVLGEDQQMQSLEERSRRIKVRHSTTNAAQLALDGYDESMHRTICTVRN